MSSYLHLTTDSIEFCAWQTKRKDADDKTKPQPLICPLMCFSPEGYKWWTALVEVTNSRLKCEVSKDDDFMLPQPGKHRLKFCPRPCPNSQALRWCRTLLAQSAVKLPQSTIMLVTLAAFRVFMPNLAFQMQVSRERRRYLGRWASEETADTYTREHRNVVFGIWREVR